MSPAGPVHVLWVFLRGQGGETNRVTPGAIVKGGRGMGWWPGANMAAPVEGRGGGLVDRQSRSRERGPQIEPQSGHDTLGTHCAFPSRCAHIVVHDLGPNAGPTLGAGIRRSTDMLGLQARAVIVVSWARVVLGVSGSRWKQRHQTVGVGHRARQQEGEPC